MQERTSKKVITYFFLFLTIGTFHNKNLNELGLVKLNQISITGLDEKYNYQLLKNLDFIKNHNLFFLNKIEVASIIDKNSLVEKYSVFKKYPSSLNIEIDKTNFLAKTKKDDHTFLLGSNGKFTKLKNENYDVPFIFGNFEIMNFFDLRKAIMESNFDYEKIKNLFFFKSGRWDIETNDGLLIKLPKENMKKSLEMVLIFFEKKNEKKEIKIIDLRQSNQIIIDAR